MEGRWWNAAGAVTAEPVRCNACLGVAGVGSRLIRPETCGGETGYDLSESRATRHRRSNHDARKRLVPRSRTYRAARNDSRGKPRGPQRDGATERRNHDGGANREPKAHRAEASPKAWPPVDRRTKCPPSHVSPRPGAGSAVAEQSSRRKPRGYRAVPACPVQAALAQGRRNVRFASSFSFSVCASYARRPQAQRPAWSRLPQRMVKRFQSIRFGHRGWT